MPDQIAPRDEPDGLGEAESRVNEACALLVRGDLAGMEQAGVQFQKAIEMLTGWQPCAAHSPRRIELHKSIQRAGRLLDAAGRWCGYRRSILIADDTAPPCYGANGRPVAAPAGGSMTLQG